MFLLDTNVLSALRRPETAPAQLIAWAAETPIADLYMSAMSVYEIDIGIRRIERRDVIQGGVLRDWFNQGVLGNFRDRVLPIDASVAIKCAELQVPDPKAERDRFIAATALVHHLVLVTRKVRDFAATGVEILNPWSDQP
jgi:predicted nucleic acid-binding protein